MSTREQVYHRINEERDYQDSLKVGPTGRTDGQPKSVGDYLTLIRTLSVKADESYYGNPGNQPALHIIRKIAAVAVRCMEVHGAPERRTGNPGQ